MSGEEIESLQLVGSQSVGKNLSKGTHPSYCVMISFSNCKSNQKAGSALLTAPCEGFTNTNSIYLLSCLQHGKSTLSSIKNSSTRFYICSFTERENSNPVLYPVLHIVPIIPTSMTMILTDRQCKAWSGRVSSQCNQVLQILVARRTVFTLHICQREYIILKQGKLCFSDQLEQGGSKIRKVRIFVRFKSQNSKLARLRKQYSFHALVHSGLYYSGYCRCMQISL